jgi:hypothetical protein
MNLPWDILIASADLEGRRALSNILAELGVDPLHCDGEGRPDFL